MPFPTKDGSLEIQDKIATTPEVVSNATIKVYGPHPQKPQFWSLSSWLQVFHLLGIFRSEAKSSGTEWCFNSHPQLVGQVTAPQHCPTTLTTGRKEGYQTLEICCPAAYIFGLCSNSAGCNLSTVPGIAKSKIVRKLKSSRELFWVLKKGKQDSMKKMGNC